MMTPRFQSPRSKYGVDQTPLGKLKRTCHHCGCVFDSVRELLHHHHLLEDEARGRVRGHQCQYRIYLEWDGKRIRPHGGKRDSAIDIDFYVELNGGGIELHEVKGMIQDADPVTRLWRLKLGIVALMYPDWRIRLF